MKRNVPIGVTNSLNIKIHNSVEEAPNYNELEEKFETLNLDKVLIVKNGTEEGRSTLDLQLVGADGKKYVAMITACLIKNVTDLVKE